MSSTPTAAGPAPPPASGRRGLAGLARGAAWNIAGKAVHLAVTMVALVIIARIVGPQAYGVFTLTWVTVGLVEIFAIMAPIETVVQRRRIASGHLDAVFWASFALGTAGWGLLVISSELQATLLGGGSMLAAILPARAATLPLAGLAVVPLGLLLRRTQFRALAALESLASIAASVTGVGLAWAGAGVWSLVAMELVRAAITLVAGYSVTRWRPGFAMRGHHFRELAGFSASTWGAWGVMYVDAQLPRALLARSLGSAAVGLYALALRLHEQVVSLLIRPAYQVVQAGVARGQDDPAAVRRIALAAMRASAVLSCPLFLGLGALAPSLVPALFGAAWIDAVPVIQVMMLFAIRSPITMVQMAVLRGVGKANWHFGVAVAGACLTVVLLLLALPWGVVAVAAAMGVRGMLLFPMQAVLVQRLTGLRVAEQALAGAGAFATALLMAVWVWALVPWLETRLPALPAMGIAALAGAIFYWVVLHVFSPGAARLVDGLAAAVLRRDFGALRTILQG